MLTLCVIVLCVSAGNCAAECLPSFINDGICHSACNNYDCDYDGDDCVEEVIMGTVIGVTVTGKQSRGC